MSYPATMTFQRLGRAGSGGFTLIELLIALTVLSLLVGVLFAGLRMGDRAWSAVEKKSVDLSEMRFVWGYLDGRFQDFLPTVHELDGERRMLFFGFEDAVEFVSSSSYQNGFGGYYIVRLQLLPGVDGKRLALRQWLYQSQVLEGTDDTPEWSALVDDRSSGLLDREGVNVVYSEAVLLENIEDFSIEYWGATDTTEEESWQGEWQEKIKTPSLIKMSIKKNGAQWPDLNFAPVQAFTGL